MKRRSFVKTSIAGSLAIATSGFPLSAAAAHELTQVTILHTNDVHSRVEPFPMDGSRNEGKGGASRRASLIKSIRAKEEHVLLLDAGDIFQGTPYFNFFGGELEFKLMSEMGYDAATIGNHDFDGGIEGLHKQLPHARFDLLCANYDVTNTVLHDAVKPFKVFRKDGIKIGVTGVGIKLDGLVPKALYKETQYNDPIAALNKTAKYLKNDLDCDYVICLSHLGFKYREEKISDIAMASQTEHVDLIIGGHTHTFLSKPEVLKNRVGEPIIINQVGWAGIMLGRIDLIFEKAKTGQCSSCRNLFIG